jgi:2-hydroxy-3-oxopropionate reductase
VVALGAEKASSNKEVASKSDVIITMLPNSPNVREAILGKDGVAEGIKAGAVVVDMSSIAPSASREVGEGLKAKGLRFWTPRFQEASPRPLTGLWQLW